MPPRSTRGLPELAIEAVNRSTDAGPGETGIGAIRHLRARRHRFIGINGGPEFPFSEAVSFLIDCEDQDEVDYYWNGLVAGGEESPCGW